MDVKSLAMAARGAGNAAYNVGKNFVTQTVPQASKVANELYGNIRYAPASYRNGMAMRLMRGGFGDAALNTDMPDAHLAQQQIPATQAAALDDNLNVVRGVAGMVAAPEVVAMGARGLAGGATKYVKDKSTGKFLTNNIINRVLHR